MVVGVGEAMAPPCDRPYDDVHPPYLHDVVGAVVGVAALGTAFHTTLAQLKGTLATPFVARG